MTVTGSGNKGLAPLRIWDLNENSTRYDRIVAAPSDEKLVQYWISWSAILSVFAVFILILCLSILSSPKARRNSFNLYIVYLTIPDFLFSFLCMVTCSLNASKGEYWSGWMCTFQQWYCVFGIGSNAWLNAAITRELHSMLLMSSRGQRYLLPSRIKVSKQAAIIYIYCAFLGSWGFFDDKENFPYATGPSVGLACLPQEQDKASSLFFWLCFMPLFVGIPFFYVVFMSYDILIRRKILPPTGRRRGFVVYFFRLIFVFVAMWLPTFIILFVLPSWVPVGTTFAGGTWSHIQGFASTVACLFKADIFRAVKRFLTCQCGKEEPESTERGFPTRENFRRESLGASKKSGSIYLSSSFLSPEQISSLRAVAMAPMSDHSPNFLDREGEGSNNLEDSSNDEQGATEDNMTVDDMDVNSDCGMEANEFKSKRRRKVSIVETVEEFELFPIGDGVSNLTNGEQDETSARDTEEKADAAPQGDLDDSTNASRDIEAGTSIYSV